MTNREIKELLISELNNLYDVKRVGYEYKIRCPFCGDSARNPWKKRLYIRINTNDNLPIKFNCFKCGRNGILDKEDMLDMGIENNLLLSSISKLNKTSDKEDSKGMYISKDNYIRTLSFKYPEVRECKKLSYIRNRLNINFTLEDFSNMKVVTSLYEFLKINEIRSSIFTKDILDILDKYYIGFISSYNSHILFRIIDDTLKYPKWVKYPIVKESVDMKCIYSIDSYGDVYSKDKFIVNIAEGVLDILSINYNFDFKSSNTMNLVIGGKDYRNIFLYLISLGVIGSNVEINIFADNDEEFNKTAKNPTTMKWFKNNISFYKNYFKSINIYYNKKKKDFGYPKEDIIYEKNKL